jgi:hypothetical protein
VTTDRPGWVEVRDPATGKLVLRYDPQRDLVETARRGRVTVTDLRRERERAEQEAEKE